MDAVLDRHQIEQVIKAPSDAAGSFRDVWFFGDIVIKRDKKDTWGTAGCAIEYERSKELSDTTFKFRGETWSLRFPKTSMIGDYLIMERIYGESASAEVCTDCKPSYENDGEYSYWYHTSEGCCFLSDLDNVVNNICWRLGIYDMHDLNWRFDRELRTVWVVDFAG